MLGESLDSIDNYDMYGLSGAMRKTAKLLKILLRKGPEPCNDLMGKIKSGLRREDMISKMKERSIHLKKRGTHRIYNYIAKHWAVSRVFRNDNYKRMAHVTVCVAL